MNANVWLNFLQFGENALYVWGSYLVALALVLTEIVLFFLRGKTILGHLGWARGFRQPMTARKRRSGDL